MTAPSALDTTAPSAPNTIVPTVICENYCSTYVTVFKTLPGASMIFLRASMTTRARARAFDVKVVGNRRDTTVERRSHSGDRGRVNSRLRRVIPTFTLG